jgi:glucokinase
MLLAGDIGGTKTQLGLFEADGRKFRLVRKEIYRSQHYSGLGEIVGAFVAGLDSPITAAGFGIAGPIIDGVCNTTNLPWVVSGRHLAEQLSLSSVELLNDLEAIAHGVALLSPDEMVTLNEGDQVPGNAGIVAAGTGLGIANLFWNGERHIPSASEGGHVDFAPRDQLEFELLRYLLTKYERVSVERVVSGPGIFAIYEFLRSAGYGSESPELALRLTREDPSSVVSAAALSGESPLAAKALDVFTSLYGSVAGNLALTIMATGGIYIGGGIAPKIIEKMKDGTFLGAFLAKGRFTQLMARIPVRIILNNETPLLGAARVAADR